MPRFLKRLVHQFTTPGLFVIASGLCMSVALGSDADEVGDRAPGREQGITHEQADRIIGELEEIKRALARLEAREPKLVMAEDITPTTTATVNVSPGLSLGEVGAAVSIVEFTDYQCPYSRRFHEDTFKSLREEFIATGQVNWRVMNLPLPIHPRARQAAEAVMCAGEQGKFWEMRERVFQNQGTLDDKSLNVLAQSIDLQPSDFEVCLKSEKYVEQIYADSREAVRIRVAGTPSFVIGKSVAGGAQVEGAIVRGAQSIDFFRAAIRSEQANATSSEN